MRRILIVRLIARQGRSHANHLGKSDDGAEDYSGKVEPMSMQPVIAESAQGVTEKDRCRNDETDFRVARRRDEGVGFRRMIWIFWHDGNDFILLRVGMMRPSLVPAGTAESLP